MVHVNNHDDFKGASQQRVHFIALRWDCKHHVQKIFRIAEVVAGIHDGLTCIQVGSIQSFCLIRSALPILNLQPTFNFSVDSQHPCVTMGLHLLFYTKLLQGWLAPLSPKAQKGHLGLALGSDQCVTYPQQFCRQLRPMLAFLI